MLALASPRKTQDEINNSITKNTINHKLSLALNADTPVVKTKEGCPINKSLIYRDFRPGDIRHSNADITKAKSTVGYAPTHDIYQGMEKAIEWYIENIGKKK